MSRAGHRFKDWVKLQQLDAPVEDFADTPAQWVTIWQGQVNIVPTNGREVIRGQRIEEGITHAIDMRFNPAINPLKFSQRFLIDDESIPQDDDKRKLYINSAIDTEEKKRFWFIKCQET